MPLITYNNNIPNPPNIPASDVPKMQTNTNAIDSIIGIDHFSFNDVQGGYHQQVTLLNQSAPGFDTASGALFANLANSQSWPFWQNASGTFQLSGSSTLLPAPVTNGYIYASGLLIQFGVVVQTPGSWVGTGTVNFTGVGINTINFPNQCIAVFTSFEGSVVAGTNGAITIGSVSKTNFTWRAFPTNTLNASGFYWLAIGN